MANRTEYIEEARARFNSYHTDEWEKSYFDEYSGGYCVYHKEHKFDPKKGKFGISRGEYEKRASEILAKHGMRVVLGPEPSGDENKKADGFLNGRVFDIKSRENIFENSDKVKRKISEASKQKAEIIVFYFHDKNMFDKDIIIEGYGKYLKNSKSKRIQKVYCVVEKRLYRM